MTWTAEPDAAGRLYPSYDVVLRRASDGVERTYHMKTEWHETSSFWWEDGNGACDCNRGDDFARAGGEPEIEDRPCGHEAYLVVRFIFPDGTTLDGQDADGVCR